jgi:hypothetical protein
MRIFCICKGDSISFLSPGVLGLDAAFPIFQQAHINNPNSGLSSNTQSASRAWRMMPVCIRMLQNLTAKTLRQGTVQGPAPQPGDTRYADDGRPSLHGVHAKPPVAKRQQNLQMDKDSHGGS